MEVQGVDLGIVEQRNNTECPIVSGSHTPENEGIEDNTFRGSLLCVADSVMQRSLLFVLRAI